VRLPVRENPVATAIVVAVVVLLVAAIIGARSSVHTVDLVVQGRYTTVSPIDCGDNGCTGGGVEYRVETTAGVYVVDTLFFGDAADMYAELTPGACWTVKTVGWRNQAFSMFPRLYELVGPCRP
jgi:hypothetical protein